MSFDLLILIGILKNLILASAFYFIENCATNFPPGSMSIAETALKIILIGEDDPDDQDLLKEVFSSIDNSCSLVFTSNGSQLLNYLQNSKEENMPGLIILDYNMPELNGAEILKELKAKGYDNIPKIIWSTSGSDTYKKICLELGAHDYVVKPSRMNDLRKVAVYMLSFWKKQ